MTATAEAAAVAYIEAEFETLIAPETYTSKRDGQPKTAHNVALFIEGQGSGRLYVTQETHKQIAGMGLKRGDKIMVGVTLRVFRGDLSPNVTGVWKA